jgi:hypothetical protein
VSIPYACAQADGLVDPAGGPATSTADEALVQVEQLADLKVCQAALAALKASGQIVIESPVPTVTIVDPATQTVIAKTGS